MRHDGSPRISSRGPHRGFLPLIDFFSGGFIRSHDSGESEPAVSRSSTADSRLFQIVWRSQPVAYRAQRETQVSLHRYADPHEHWQTPMRGVETKVCTCPIMKGKNRHKQRHRPSTHMIKYGARLVVGASPKELAVSGSVAGMAGMAGTCNRGPAW